ncbi:hypothetical protein, partial [Xanthomonas oryzae]
HLGRHPNPRVSGKPAEILPTQIFREPIFYLLFAFALASLGLTSCAKEPLNNAPQMRDTICSE